jgi:hypothetical protein
MTIISGAFTKCASNYLSDATEKTLAYCADRIGTDPYSLGVGAPELVLASNESCQLFGTRLGSATLGRVLLFLFNAHRRVCSVRYAALELCRVPGRVRTGFLRKRADAFASS